MNIALIGYGRMGRTIERVAGERGHKIVLRVTSENRAGLRTSDLQAADVAIEFTGPESAKENVLLCSEAGVPVVCGSTGWGTQLPEVEEQYRSGASGALLYASNFSVGVNLFFVLAERLAALMAPHPEYALRIEETHHTQKKDAPSGTAIAIAERILAHSSEKKTWVLGEAASPEALPIVAHRVEGVPGTHRIIYSSSIDDIEAIHTAHNRDGFAFGAVLAAEFLAGKRGLFTMRNVLSLPA